MIIFVILLLNHLPIVLAVPISDNSTCIATEAQGTYTNITDYLTWNAPDHGDVWHLQLSNGRYTGDFPDPLSFNGTRVLLLNATGTVNIDAKAKTGSIHVTFFATNLQPYEGAQLTGKFDIFSTDFNSTPADDYVPFMQDGIATSLVEHGCTGQGEPGYPQLKAKFATWGHCDVYLNGTLLFPNLWLHTMYTNRMRDAVTNAIWADSAHTQVYNPLQCWQGDVVDDLPEYQFIVARWCYCADCQVHKPTDLNVIFSFTGVEEVSTTSSYTT